MYLGHDAGAVKDVGGGKKGKVRGWKGTEWLAGETLLEAISPTVFAERTLMASIRSIYAQTFR